MRICLIRRKEIYSLVYMIIYMVVFVGTMFIFSLINTKSPGMVAGSSRMLHLSC